MLQKGMATIWSKLDEHEICAIFHESIILVLNLHAPSAKDIGFVVLVQQLL